MIASWNEAPKCASQMKHNVWDYGTSVCMYWSAPPPHTRAHRQLPTVVGLWFVILFTTGVSRGVRREHAHPMGLRLRQNSQISLFLAIFYLIFIIQHPGGTESCIRQCSRTHQHKSRHSFYFNYYFIHSPGVYVCYFSSWCTHAWCQALSNSVSLHRLGELETVYY